MQELLNNSAFVALLGTIFGGAGLKLVESWLGKAKERAASEAGMREELRKEIQSLRDRLDRAAEEEKRLEALIDKWRGDYYNLRDEHQSTVTELTILKSRLEMLQTRVAQDGS